MNKILLSFICMGLTASVARAVPFQDLIEEDVQFFTTVRSISETRAQWAGHPFAELFENEELQKFFEPLMDEVAEAEDGDGPDFTDVLENEFGLTVDELFELFPGQVSFSIYNMAELMLKTDERPEGLLAAEFSGDAARLNELMRVQFERNAESQKEANPDVEHVLIEERFMGETLYFDEAFDGDETYVEDGYALVDGIFLLATPESRLRAAVEAIKEGASTPVSKAAVYLRAREAAGRGDFEFYLNLDELMPRLNEALLTQSMKGGMAMFGVTAQSLDNALSLESLQALFFDIDLTDTGLMSHGGLIYSEKRGLLTLLSYAEGDLPTAHYVPEGVLTSAISLFDFGEMLVNLEKLLAVASPSMPALIDIQMQTLKTNTGVDVRASILENLGGEMVSLSMLDQRGKSGQKTLQAEQLFVMEVKNAEALAHAIETYKGMIPGVDAFIEAQDFEGETIYTIKGPSNLEQPDASVGDFSYVITRSELIVSIGRISLLQEVLSRMGKSSSGFWQKAEVEHLFEGVARPNPVARSYVDFREMVAPFFQSMIDAGAFSQADEDMTAAKLAEILDAPYQMISEMNEEPDGFFTRVQMIKSEAAQ